MKFLKYLVGVLSITVLIGAAGVFYLKSSYDTHVGPISDEVGKVLISLAKGYSPKYLTTSVNVEGLVFNGCRPDKRNSVMVFNGQIGTSAEIRFLCQFETTSYLVEGTMNFNGGMWSFETLFLSPIISKY